MRHQVVNPIQRFAGGHRERFRRRHTHHERPGQSRASGHGDRVNITKAHSRLSQGLLQGGEHGLQMRTGGDFWDNTTEPHVLFHGGGDGVGQKFRAANNTDAGLVAGGFDAQNEWFSSCHGVLSFAVCGAVRCSPVAGGCTVATGAVGAVSSLSIMSASVPSS